MCSANHRQPNVRPHIAQRFDFLFVLTIQIASYSQDPGRFAGEESLWYRGKPGGARHAENRMSIGR